MIFFLYKLIKLPQLLNQTKILIRLNILGNQISFFLMVSWEKLKNKRTSSNSSERVHMHPISNHYTREIREKLHNFRTQRISSSLNRLCQCDPRFLWVVGLSIITSQQLDKKKQVKISTIHTKHFFFIRDENSYSDVLKKN